MSKILVSGATGLVGSELLPLLQAGDYGVSRLVREYSAVDDGDVFWAVSYTHLPLPTILLV